MDEQLTIGELGKATSTKVVTIRYYEQVGLLPAPPRTPGNYRAYGADHQHRLRFIRRCRDLGFDQVVTFSVCPLRRISPVPRSTGSAASI